MDELPWMIVHAEVVRIGFVVLVAAATAWGARAMRSALMQWRARQVRAERPTATRGVALGEQVLEGVLAAEGPAIRRFEDGRPAAIAYAMALGGDDEVWTGSDGLALIVGNERVRIEGPIRVLVGTHQHSAPIETEPRSVLDRIRAAGALPTDSTWRARSVRAGDRVRVEGRMRTESVDDGGSAPSYRDEAAAQWVIEPRHDQPVVLCSREWTRTSRVRPLLLVVASVLGGMAAWAFTEWNGASLSDDAAHGRWSFERPMDALRAALVPSEVRRALLDRATRQVHHEPAGRRHAAREAALVALSGGYADPIASLVRHGELDMAIALGRDREGAVARRGVARAQLLRGDLGAAADSSLAAYRDDGETGFTALRALLLAGRLNEAARLAEELRIGRDSTPSRSAGLHCLALALRGQGGDRVALDRLRAQAELLGSGVCRDLALPLGEPQSARSAFAAPDGVWRMAVFDPLSARSSSELAFVGEAIVTSGESATTRIGAAVDLAESANTANEPAEARRWVERAMNVLRTAPLGETRPDQLSRLQELAAEVELRAGNVELAEQYARDVPTESFVRACIRFERQHDWVAGGLVARHLLRAESARLLHGDATFLRYGDRRSPNDLDARIDDVVLWLAGPRIRRGRAEVAQHLWRRLDIDEPWELVPRLGLAVTVAERMGDPRLAASFRRPLRALRAALHRRETFMALRVLRAIHDGA